MINIKSFIDSLSFDYGFYRFEKRKVVGIQFDCLKIEFDFINLWEIGVEVQLFSFALFAVLRKKI